MSIDAFLDGEVTQAIHLLNNYSTQPFPQRDFRKPLSKCLGQQQHEFARHIGALMVMLIDKDPDAIKVLAINTEALVTALRHTQAPELIGVLVELTRYPPNVKHVFKYGAPKMAMGVTQAHDYKVELLRPTLWLFANLASSSQEQIEQTGKIKLPDKTVAAYAVAMAVLSRHPDDKDMASLACMIIRHVSVVCRDQAKPPPSIMLGPLLLYQAVRLNPKDAATALSVLSYVDQGYILYLAQLPARVSMMLLEEEEENV